jgi:chromosome segregation ATPase
MASARLIFLLLWAFSSSALSATSTNPTFKLQRALTMNEMFTELDDIANIMNEEFKQRREASLTREKDCHHRGVALRVDEGGVREQANSTRLALVHINVETRDIMHHQNELLLLTNTLTAKVTNIGNELRDTENDVLDAERLSQGNVDTYQSHKEKHEKNLAIVDELIHYLQNGTPGGDVISGSDVTATEAVATTSLRPPSFTTDATLVKNDGNDAQNTVTQSPRKLTLLLNEIKQSMTDFAPQRDMSHEQLKSSHSQLINTLDLKMDRLQKGLQELQKEKIKTSDELASTIIKMKQVTSKTNILEKSLAQEKLHLTNVRKHIKQHEKMCDMMEVKFNELRTLMMDDLGMVKEIKNMLSKHQLDRVRLVADNLAEDLETPP